jgi:hypothetical protein
MKKSILATLLLFLQLIAIDSAHASLVTQIGTADYNGNTYNLIYYSEGTGTFDAWVLLDYSLPYSDYLNIKNEISNIDSNIGNFHYNQGVSITYDYPWEPARVYEYDMVYNNKNKFNALFSNYWAWSNDGYFNYEGYIVADYYNMDNGSSEQVSLYNQASGIPRRYAQASITNSAVPEPSTFLLLGAGLTGLALIRRKARK